MHELRLIQRIMTIVADSADRQSIGHICRIHLVIGGLHPASPDALRFAFAAITPDTRFARAELEIDLRPVTVVCADCNAHSTEADAMFFCPHCQSSATRLLTGDELEISWYEADEEKCTPSLPGGTQ